MDLALPEEVAAQLQHCQATLASLEEKARPFLNRSTKDIDSQMDPIERAQVYLALAQTINSLFGLYLKATGIAPEDHGTSKEKERLKAFDKKVRKAVANTELSESRRSIEVNVMALNRVITHAVPDLSVQQKQALKAKGKAANRQVPAGTVAMSLAAEEGREQQTEGSSRGGSRKKARQGVGTPRDEALAFLEEAMADIQGGGAAAAARQGPAGKQ